MTAVVMEPEPEPEHEDMGAEDEGFEDLTSSPLFQSVMYAETPEQTLSRLRSERDETQATLQTAAELGMALQQDTEGKDEQLAELEEALAEKTRELEEAQYRTEEVEQQMREVDERYRERERQLEEREQEVAAAPPAAPPSRSQLSASRIRSANARAAAAAERDKEKEALIQAAATKEGHLRREIEDLMTRAEQERDFRHSETVRAFCARPRVCRAGWLTACRCARARPRRRRRRPSMSSGVLRPSCRRGKG